MHHASDETSRPSRRRLLGRGPGVPEPVLAAPVLAEPVPAEPVPAVEPVPGEAPGAAVEAAPTAASGPVAEPDPVAETDPVGESVRATGPLGEPEPLREPEPVGGAEAVGEVEAVGGAEVVGEVEAVREPEPVGESEAAGAAEPVGGGAEPVGEGEVGDGRFTVRLANFEGPFDLLLQLITKHKLDVTEVALSQVTDEFMAHLRALGPDGDLDQTTEFLVVAATLLDLKAARLLPAAEVEDEADLALLEARDLLFARLLQYRAYKRIAAIFEERWETEGRRHPRTVGLEPHHAELLPEVVISIGAEGFAKLAVKAMRPKPEPQVYVDHIHAPLVSVREQAAVVVALLRERGTAVFRELIEDAGDTLTVVARFLALLELYREKAVALDQETALGDLTVSWTGGETDPSGAVTDEFDQEATA